METPDGYHGFFCRQSNTAQFVRSEGYSHDPREYYSHSSEDYSHQPQTLTNTAKNISSSTVVTPTAGSLSKSFKQEVVDAPGSHFSLLQAAMNYTHMGSQFMQNNPYETTESHQQDVSRLPSFAVCCEYFLHL